MKTSVAIIRAQFREGKGALRIFQPPTSPVRSPIGGLVFCEAGDYTCAMIEKGPGVKLNCVVTAGPTYEELDKARRITNFSTGRLGCEFANFLYSRGHDVTLLVGQQATWLGERKATTVKAFSTGTSLSEQLEGLSGSRINAVFHAAAVADFKFGKVWSGSEDGSLEEISGGKFSTREGTLLAELVPTPKIIGRMRAWFPSAVLVGWKYEVDGNREEVLKSAREQLTANRTDACVANGPAYGLGFGIVTKTGELKKCRSGTELYAALEEFALAGLKHGL